MPDKVIDRPIVQIFSSRFPHDPIEIIGNRLGLDRMINTMIDAVTLGRGTGEIYSSDGYDSEILVACLRGKRRAEEWRRAGSPQWDIDDPLIARIVDLTQENERLRKIISMLRCERKPVVDAALARTVAEGDATLLPPGLGLAHDELSEEKPPSQHD
jgi:hypothetical protein